MAKAIYLAQIRNRMESIQKEYNVLSEAYRILQSVGASRGRKAKIPTLQQMLSTEVKVKTGKRGRPPGAKNKPGSKKTGPKKASALLVSSVAPLESPANENAVPASKPVLSKSLAKKKSAKAIKPSKPSAAKKGIVKPLESPVKENVVLVSKPVLTKSVAQKKSAKAVKPSKSSVSKKGIVKPLAKAKKLVKKPTASKPSKPGKRNRIPDLAEKIQGIVGSSARFTTNSVITDKLASLYPGKSRSDLGKYISVILSNMKARKELVVVTQDAKGNKMRSGLWGLPTWFDGTKPKVEFLK
jgi:hypothetical protein